MSNTLGSLRIYRIYDLGYEINLKEAFEKLSVVGPTNPFNLKKQTKNFLFSDPPLVINLGEITVNGANVSLMGKLWNYGAASLEFRIESPQKMERSHLVKWMKDWSTEPALDELGQLRVDQLIKLLGRGIVKPELWNQYEDYIIFVANPECQSLDFWKENNFVYHFIGLESQLVLSDAMIEPVKESALSYSTNDLVVVDWDSGFVYAKEDVDDICDVLELANVQLLELRYYDTLLDAKLSGLYRQVITKKPSIFNRRVELLSKDASSLYIETSEVVERIENSLKIIGDVYFARLYRIALKRLQVPQWQNLVDQKLRNLFDISQMYMGELHTKRSHYMEIIIIILIAIEVVPFLYPYVAKLLIGLDLFNL